MMKRHDDGRYNGWPTYETWLVYTWLTNDPNTDEDCRSIAHAAEDLASAAEALKAYVEEDSPLVDQASLYSDLVGAALGRVEWMAIAPHFCDAQRGAQS